MYSRFVAAICFLCAALAMAGSGKIEPDAVNFSASAFESPYFKFHYSLPEGWQTLDDVVRIGLNRTRHKEALKRASAHWTYELLLAAPTPVLSDEKLSLPYIHILALEDVPAPMGTYAKMLSRTKSLKLLRQHSLTISGHPFVESNLQSANHSETLFDTTVRNYLLVFEFHGRTQEEMEALAKTMASIKFDK